MSHPPETSEPLLSHNQESMTEHRKPRAPQQVQILSQEDPEMDQARTAYLKGFSDGQLKVFETIHELSYKCKTTAEMVLKLGELYGEFIMVEDQKKTKSARGGPA